MKALSVFIAIGAVALLTCGLYSYRASSLAPSEPVSVVVVEAPERDLGDRPIGPSRVVFRVTNSSDRTAEVISVPSSCGKNGCLRPIGAERQVIPAGGSIEVVCELVVLAPEVFEIGGTIYLNDNGLRTVNLNVSGTGRSRDANNEPK